MSQNASAWQLLIDGKKVLFPNIVPLQLDVEKYMVFLPKHYIFSLQLLPASLCMNISMIP